jgi:hypothetical protein
MVPVIVPFCKLMMVLVVSDSFEIENGSSRFGLSGRHMRNMRKRHERDQADEIVSLITSHPMVLLMNMLRMTTAREAQSTLRFGHRISPIEPQL